MCLVMYCLLADQSRSRAALLGGNRSTQGNLGESCQTVVPRSVPSELPQGGCQTIPPCFCIAPSLQHKHMRGTWWRHRPRARLRGSAFHKLNRSWAYRGCRLGEASHPGPIEEEPARSATLHRVPMGGEAPRPCTIRMAPQGGVWIWIVHSHPPLLREAQRSLSHKMWRTSSCKVKLEGGGS